MCSLNNTPLVHKLRLPVLRRDSFGSSAVNLRLCPNQCFLVYFTTPLCVHPLPYLSFETEVVIFSKPFSVRGLQNEIITIPVEVDPLLLLTWVKNRSRDARKSAWNAGACGATSDGLSYKIVRSCTTTLAIHSAGLRTAAQSNV